MKNLISILLMFVFFWLSSTKAFADVIFDDVNMTLHVPASKAEHELIVGFNNGQLSRLEQRNALTRFHTELNIKYVKKGMTELQRAEVALQKINLLRQAGALTIQRVPTNRRLENITYEYVIIHQDAKINAGGGLLYFGDIDLQLKYLAALLGAEVDFDIDHSIIKAHPTTKNLINSADLFSLSDERNENELEDDRRFNQGSRMSV